MQKIVRRFSDRITTQHDVDNTLRTRSHPNFLRTWSLRRKPKSGGQPQFCESTSASSFIDPGHPPDPISFGSPDHDTSLSAHRFRPPGLPHGPGRQKPKSALHRTGDGPCVKYVEPVDISSLSSNEHLDHRNGTLSKKRNSHNRLSTELSLLSHDKELNEAIETGFKNNFVCTKTEIQTTLQTSEDAERGKETAVKIHQYPAVVSMISYLVFLALPSRLIFEAK